MMFYGNFLFFNISPEMLVDACGSAIREALGGKSIDLFAAVIQGDAP